MKMVFTYRALWITCLAWLGLVTLNQILRGLPLVQGQMDTGQYWTLQIIIGLLLGASVHVVLSIVQVLKKN